MPKFPNAHALIVGIEDYDDPRIPSLSLATQDAQNVWAVLTDPAYCGYERQDVHLLSGKQATRQGILSIVDRLAKDGRINEDSTVLFYYCGHGGHFFSGDYLLPRDVDCSSEQRF